MAPRREIHERWKTSQRRFTGRVQNLADPFNFEDQKNGDFNHLQGPPTLFEAMSSDEQRRYPPPPSPTELACWEWSIEDRALDVINDLHPNPFLNGGILGCVYPIFRARWTAKLMFEPENIDGYFAHPHGTLRIIQSFDGREAIMLLGELAPILTAMHNRATQIRVPEDQLEAVFEESPVELRSRTREFGKAIEGVKGASVVAHHAHHASYLAIAEATQEAEDNARASEPMEDEQPEEGRGDEGLQPLTGEKFGAEGETPTVLPLRLQH
ncbi:hypothetical protein BBP40_001512 [Aspergillus hancockii]|nr:hypothetical protein BBP40_001512 [Aspergillus hancockii]